MPFRTKCRKGAHRPRGVCRSGRGPQGALGRGGSGSPGPGAGGDGGEVLRRPLLQLLQATRQGRPPGGCAGMGQGGGGARLGREGAQAVVQLPPHRHKLPATAAVAPGVAVAQQANGHRSTTFHCDPFFECVFPLLHWVSVSAARSSFPPTPKVEISDQAHVETASLLGSQHKHNIFQPYCWKSPLLPSPKRRST